MEKKETNLILPVLLAAVIAAVLRWLFGLLLGRVILIPLVTYFGDTGFLIYQVLSNLIAVFVPVLIALFAAGAATGEKLWPGAVLLASLVVMAANIIVIRLVTRFVQIPYLYLVIHALLTGIGMLAVLMIEPKQETARPAAPYPAQPSGQQAARPYPAQPASQQAVRPYPAQPSGQPPVQPYSVQSAGQPPVQSYPAQPPVQPAAPYPGMTGSVSGADSPKVVYCRNCGNIMNENAVICVKCGAAKGSGNNFCPHCGNPVNPQAAVCLNCGGSLAGTAMAAGENAKSKMAAGLLGIFLGGLGIHNFYLGYTKKAVAQLLICLLGSCLLIGPAVSGIWGLVEGIMILAGKINVDGNGNPLKN